ncbi:hypothetical protein [Streptomyces sp. HO565]|uniref:hypothetical protein n=1 Tax=Streptomyces sp. HO565 TaxID=2857489 RepID=UPI0034DBB026
MAFGAIGGVNFAFALATLPGDANVARDLGLVNTAATLPYSFIPLTAPLLLASAAATTTRRSSPPEPFCACSGACLWRRSARPADLTGRPQAWPSEEARLTHRRTAGHKNVTC